MSNKSICNSKNFYCCVVLWFIREGAIYNACELPAGLALNDRYSYDCYKISPDYGFLWRLFFKPAVHWTVVIIKGLEEGNHLVVLVAVTRTVRIVMCPSKFAAFKVNHSGPGLVCETRSFNSPDNPGGGGACLTGSVARTTCYTPSGAGGSPLEIVPLHFMDIKAQESRKYGVLMEETGDF